MKLRMKECRWEECKMVSHILTFIGGLMVGGGFGVVIMCCMLISGQESRKEELREKSHEDIGA